MLGRSLKNMPLESREDYIELNKHLWELEPTIKNFASDMGYEYGPPLTNGLYPKIRIWRTKHGISQDINFDMSLDDRNSRFDCFFPEIPYSIFAGSWIDDQEKRIRHHGSHVGVHQIPFSALLASISDFLEHFHNYNESIKPELIYACNFSSELHGNPP